MPELGSALEGSFFQKLAQTAEDEWILRFRKGGEDRFLVITLASGLCRFHLISGWPERVVKPGPFTRMLRKVALRSVLSSIRQINDDRIIRMEFDGAGGRWALVIELASSFGNIYLVDEKQNVVAIALSRKTRNTIGRPYLPPDAPTQRAGEEDEESDTHKPGPSAGEPFPRNAGMEKMYAGVVARHRLDRLKNQASAPLRAKLKKLRKKKNGLEKERKTLESYAKDRKLGDLLQANFHRLKRGDPSIEVQDVFSQGGETVTIELDPGLSPSDNVKRYYKRHRKFEKGLPRVIKDLAVLETAREDAETKLDFIESCADPDTLAAMIPHRPETASGKKVSGKKQPSGPRRFMTSDGTLVLVGRNDRENDEITFRIANGRDLWLHARDYPGSHALARLPKGADIPGATLREAAMLALNYSRAAKSGKGEVTYCRAKDIRKPKGAPPGKVLAPGAKSVFVRIDPDVIRAMRERAEKEQ